MSETQLKENLIGYIQQADERILRAMYAMLQNYLAVDDQIVAFSSKGEPLTKKELTNRLNEAVTDVENGKGLSSDDIREAKKSW